MDKGGKNIAPSFVTHAVKDKKECANMPAARLLSKTPPSKREVDETKSQMSPDRSNKSANDKKGQQKQLGEDKEDSWCIENAVGELCIRKLSNPQTLQCRILGKEEHTCLGVHVNHEYFYVVDVVAQEGKAGNDTINVKVVRIEDEISSTDDASVCGSAALDDVIYSKRTIYPGAKEFARLVPPPPCVRVECQRRVEQAKCQELNATYVIMRSKICPHDITNR